MCRLLKSALTAACIVTTAGCAYLTNYTRAVDLKESSYVIDVKQRVVFSQKSPGPDPHTVVCAEPSPDALTVIGVSGGLSLNSAQTDITGNVGGALSENGAYVGLRTHSIQLLRDAMYRLCEGYAAGAINALTFQSMQRRYQSTMMGLIAIEQLTGPVVASQALLTTAAAAQSGVTPGDAALVKAQERGDSTTEGQLAAQSKLEESDAKVEAALKKAQTADKALAQERAKKEPNKATVDELTAEAATAKDELATARRTREAARRSLSVAEDKAKSAAQDLRAAQSRVSAMAGGTGKLGDVSGAVASSNEALTAGVVNIVREINSSYLRDSCISFSSDLLRDPSLIRDLQGLTTAEEKTTVSPVRMVQSLIVVCQEVLRYDAERLARQSGATDMQVGDMKNRISAPIETPPAPSSDASKPTSGSSASKP